MTWEMWESGDEDAANDMILAALTQLVRMELIDLGLFPASRPELAEQLRQIRPGDSLAKALDDAMFTNLSSEQLFEQLKHARPQLILDIPHWLPNSGLQQTPDSRSLGRRS
jgi:hypothetical protein